MNKLCGRVAEVESLKTALTSQSQNFEIIGISGYGGVGKTYLVNHAMDEVRPDNDGRLVLWVDAAAKGLAEDFMRILTEMLAPRLLRGIPKADTKEFFPRIRTLSHAYTAAYAGLISNINSKKTKSNSEGFDRVKQAVVFLCKAGDAFNGASSKKKRNDLLREYKLEDCAEAAFELIRPYAEDPSWLPAFMQELFGITYQRKIRTQLFDLAAEELLADLTAMLVGYRPEDWAQYFPGKIKGFDRLLLVVDDLEILGRTLIPFFIGHLFPKLKAAKFKSQVILIGRDALRDSDPGFEHHFASNIIEQIRLHPFTENEAMELLKDAGYSPERSREINEQCKGLPFLLTAFAESHNQDVLFYQRFFDRTTRWMTETQKEWFLSLCYLDVVNQDTIAAMLPEATPTVVMDWFRHEASIRDDSAQQFRVKPFICEMVKKHHLNELGLKSQAAWISKGRVASIQAET